MARKSFYNPDPEPADTISVSQAADDDDHLGLDLLASLSRQGSLDDFAAGAFALTLIPSGVCSPGERAAYLGELLPLRQALIDEFGAKSASDLMLIDVAAVGYFEARRLGTKASALLGSGVPDKIRLAETIDRAAQRAHLRFASSVELLRRGRLPQLSVAVEPDAAPTDSVLALDRRRPRGRK